MYLLRHYKHLNYLKMKRDYDVARYFLPPLRQLRGGRVEVTVVVVVIVVIVVVLVIIIVELESGHGPG